MVNYDLEQELQQDLSVDEKFLWTGKPKAGFIFRSSDIFMIPFSLLWCGFACFWEFSVVSTKAPFFFKLWGIPFVLMGLYIVIGRFFVDAAKRGKTVYGITKDRVIIKSGLFSQEIKSLNIKTISDISLRQSENQSGTISFGPTDYRYAMLQGMEWPGVKQPPRLEFIDDVKAVYDKIILLQKEPN